MLIYATESDLATWLGTDIPTNARTLLRSASGLVSDATAGDLYEVDDEGFPSHTSKREAMMEATCAQVEMWAAAKIDPTAAGLAQIGVAQSKKIGTASVQYDTAGVTAAAVAQQRIDAAKCLCDDARRILQKAHLASTSVWTYG